MRVLVIENWVATPIGQIGPALHAAGVATDTRAAWDGAAIPVADAGYDGLVVLGGEQSARDDADCPWLPETVALIQQFAEKDKAVLGVCLGAQLVARALGADNVLGLPVEFGWHYVRPTAAGRHDPVISALGAGAPLFHWHTDTFTLPPHAERLAESDMTEIQAFRVGRAVYGLQFHFEADLPLVEAWSRTFADVISGYAPNWPQRLRVEAARSAPVADATGAAIARAWTSLIR